MVKGFYETAKINILIGDEEKKIKNACYEIGKIYASLHKSDFEQDFAAWMGIVNESEQKIEHYKRQIEKIKSVKRCSCGAELIEGMGFCAACGKPVQKQETADEIRCIHCGKPVKKDAKFCIHCGMLMEKPEDPPVEEIKEQTCPVCGERIEKGVKFCIYCGNPVKKSGDGNDEVVINSGKKICPKCGVEVEQDALFCTGCGEKLTQKEEIESENVCPNCGELLEGHPEYCTKCGRILIIRN
ncbi:MAG: zinc-ribbon domain-containing protein [Blautia sp.]